MLQQAWLKQGRQGGGQPHSGQGLERQQEVVLEHRQCCPPLASHGIVIGPTGGCPFGQQLPQAVQPH
jgi:hypothetical protein